MAAAPFVPRLVSALGALIAICACGGSPGRPSTEITPSSSLKPTTATGSEVRAYVRDASIEELQAATMQLWVTNRDTREAALELMVEADPSLLRDAWPLLLTDGDAQMRQTTVDFLTDLGGTVAIEWLQMATYDHHPAVRQAAEEGLAELGAAY